MGIFDRKGVEAREVQMTLEFSWHESYRAALLETDWAQILQRIQEAEFAMLERKRVLSLNHGGTPEERHALAAALSGLIALRRDVDEWQDRQQRFESPA